jgi:ribose transport system permease protein
VVLLSLILIFSLINHNFFSVNNARNLLQQTSSAGIAAAGLVFVLVTGGIDVSIGSTLFMTSIISALLTDNGLGFWGAVGASMLCGALIGCVNGFFIAKIKMTPLIVTLAMMYIIRGVAITIVGIKTTFFNNPIGIFIARTRLFTVIPVVVAVLAVTAAIAQFILGKTLFGKQLYAIGNNRTAAEISGIKVTRNIFISYVICGMLAGLSGLISGAQVGGISPTFAQGQEFIIICSTVLGGVSLFGGRGKVFPGAFLGVLIIMCIENGLVMARTNMYAYTIIRGIIIFIAVMLDSQRNRGETR